MTDLEKLAEDVEYQHALVTGQLIRDGRMGDKEIVAARINITQKAIDRARLQGRIEGLEEAAKLATQWGWSDKPDWAHGIAVAIRARIKELKGE